MRSNSSLTNTPLPLHKNTSVLFWFNVAIDILTAHLDFKLKKVGKLPPFFSRKFPPKFLANKLLKFQILNRVEMKFKHPVILYIKRVLYELSAILKNAS